jgi:hypothetical protein
MFYLFFYFAIKLLFYSTISWVQWLTPAMLATQEDHSWKAVQNVNETPSQPVKAGRGGTPSCHPSYMA